MAKEGHEERERRKLAEIATDTQPPPSKKAKVEAGHVSTDAPQTTNEPIETGSIKGDVVMGEAIPVSLPSGEGAATAAERVEENKVAGGNRKIKAHPFTVRIDNLDHSAEDMELVDLLRPKCGAIVTARVLRDKFSKQSRGCALVQFEERSGVAKALALHDTLGLKERSLQITPSHLPAAMLVTHQRVQPKGQGKYSRRNERRREARAKTEDSKPEQSSTTEEVGAAKPPPATNVLAFQPRGLKRKKAKMNLKKK